MRYPNVPIQKTQDWERRTGSAVNYLLNRLARLTFVIDGKPADGQRVLRFPLREPMTLVLADCKAEAETASTGNVSFDIQLDGVSIGSVAFATGNLTGAVSLSSTDLPTGSFLEVFAPSPQDATLSDVSITLAATR